MFRLKRAYERPAKDDGERILVERLWPRGVTKEKARLDGWMKEVAPSPELRKWFGHDPGEWNEFRKRYAAELRQHEQELKDLQQRGEEQTVTLVYGARDEEHNSAVLLKEYLEGHKGQRKPRRKS
jgi:uncharacterized protein YeaO (DUF488 family)